MSEANPKGEYQDDTSKVGHCQANKYKPLPYYSYARGFLICCSVIYIILNTDYYQLSGASFRERNLSIEKYFYISGNRLHACKTRSF